MLDTDKSAVYRGVALLAAMALALTLAPGALAQEASAPATTQSDDGDVCVHQPQPDPHQAPCLVTVSYPDGGEGEVCTGSQFVSGLDRCHSTDVAEGGTYDVCLPSPDPHKRQVCLVSVWVP